MLIALTDTNIKSLIYLQCPVVEEYEQEAGSHPLDILNTSIQT